MIYLDNAATTLPKPDSVGAAVLQALSNCGNAGRGAHSAALYSAETLYACRENVCRLFGQDDPEQVVFTLNTTHALNIAIKGILRNGGHCVISGYEHNSVVRPLYAMREKNVSFTSVQTPLFEPETFLQEFEASIRPDTVCAICTHVSNVFGYILPIKEVDELCVKHGVPMIIDAAQSAGGIPVRLDELKAAICICAPGHKGLYGPQGTGIMICKDGSAISSLMEGGTGSRSSQMMQPDFLPDRHESGTQNIHGIAGLNAGIDYVLGRGLDTVFKHERQLISFAAEELQKIDGISVFSGKDQSGVLSFVSNRNSPEEITEFLGDRGIAVRGGFHCAPLAHQTVGTKNGCVRISVSDLNRIDDIDAFLQTLREL